MRTRGNKFNAPDYSPTGNDSYFFKSVNDSEIVQRKTGLDILFMKFGGADLSYTFEIDKQDIKASDGQSNNNVEGASKLSVLTDVGIGIKKSELILENLDANLTSGWLVNRLNTPLNKAKITIPSGLLTSCYNYLTGTWASVADKPTKWGLFGILGNIQAYTIDENGYNHYDYSDSDKGYPYLILEPVKNIIGNDDAVLAGAWCDDSFLSKYLPATTLGQLLAEFFLMQGRYFFVNDDKMYIRELASITDVLRLQNFEITSIKRGANELGSTNAITWANGIDIENVSFIPHYYDFPILCKNYSVDKEKELIKLSTNWELTADTIFPSLERVQSGLPSYPLTISWIDPSGTTHTAPTVNGGQYSYAVGQTSIDPYIDFVNRLSSTDTEVELEGDLKATDELEMYLPCLVEHDATHYLIHEIESDGRKAKMKGRKFIKLL